MTKPAARDQVLRHALECFLRFGYERTAKQDIAVAAGRLVLAEGVAAGEAAELMAAMARGVNARLPAPKAETLLETYSRNAELVLRGVART